MSGRQPQRYQPRTPHRGRPDGLQPIMNRLPGAIRRIWEDLSRAYAISTGLYLLKLDVSRDRSGAFLSNLSDFLCVLLDYCQPKDGGLIAVPYGKTKMPLTKCRRVDFKNGSKDYMRGLAELSKFSVGTCYGMFFVLRTLGIVVHDGYDHFLNARGQPIRISRYCIPGPVRQWLFKITQTPDVWAKRDAKLAKAAKRREYFTATPEKPGDRGTMPKDFADRVALRKLQTRAIVDDSKIRTRLTNKLMGQFPMESIKDIVARVVEAMPQAP